MQGISDEAAFKLRRVMTIIDHSKLHLRRVNVSGPAELDCEKPGAGGDDKFTDSSLHPEIAGKVHMNLGAILPDNMLHY